MCVRIAFATLHHSHHHHVFVYSADSSAHLSCACSICQGGGGEIGGIPAYGFEAGGLMLLPPMVEALDFVDAELQSFMDTLDASGIADSTLVVVSAKHGQSESLLLLCCCCSMLDVCLVLCKRTHSCAPCTAQTFFTQPCSDAAAGRRTSQHECLTGQPVVPVMCMHATYCASAAAAY
jgi:hypothetical protein